MKLLTAPVPVFAAAIVPQLPTELVDGAPAWVLAMAVVGWVVVSVLDKLGRLPQGANGSTRPGFTAADRRVASEIRTDLTAAKDAAQKTYDLLAWKDDDGIPRYLSHVMQTRHTVEEQRKLTRLIEDNHKLVSMVVDQWKTANRRLDSIEKRLGGGGTA